MGVIGPPRFNKIGVGALGTREPSIAVAMVAGLAD